MTIKFKSKIRRHNKRGVGFIYLPDYYQNQFKVSRELKVEIVLPDNKMFFFAKLRIHNKEGIYVPSHITKKFGLLNKEANIRIKEIKGFFTKTSQDGRIYLPQNYANELKLKQNEIVLIEGIIDEKKYSEFCQVKIRQKTNTREYFCMFNPKLIKKEGIFSIKYILSRNKFRIPKKIISLIENFNYAFLNKETIVLYYGNRVPIIAKIDFDLTNISHYLGCYFADGTKNGNNWGICSSTFKQARYYIKMHNQIIINNKIIPSISFTDIKNQNESILKRKLMEIWRKETNLDIDERRTRIIKSNCAPSKKANPFGSLVLKEHKQLSQIYYNKLLNLLFDVIKKEKNKKLAFEFILGVLEGDGSVGASGELFIHSNLKELKILKEIADYTGFKFRIHIEGKNKGYVFIGLLEIIKNIPILKDKLFKYYPKRRKILKERLAQTGCARFLLGKSKKTSNWLIGQLNKYEILDKGNLTESGKKIQKDLKAFFLSKD
jgi:hypothetical protein